MDRNPSSLSPLRENAAQRVYIGPRLRPGERPPRPPIAQRLGHQDTPLALGSITLMQVGAQKPKSWKNSCTLSHQFNGAFEILRRSPVRLNRGRHPELRGNDTRRTLIPDRVPVRRPKLRDRGTAGEDWIRPLRGSCRGSRGGRDLWMRRSCASRGPARPRRGAA